MDSESVTSPEDEVSTSAELTGGAGYTYEDTVVAYYLAALLREEGAAGQSGTVERVAVQQRPQGEPLDDLVIDFRDHSSERRLSLQVKRSLTISAAASNTDFVETIENSRKTRAKAGFRRDIDRYGFVAETVSTDSLRRFRRLLEWASGSATGADFVARFTGSGASGLPERKLRGALRPIVASTADAEVDFYRHFIAPDLSGLEAHGALAASIANNLAVTLAPEGDQTGVSLFAALCREARVGAGTGKIWVRSTLLQALSPAFRLRGVPAYAEDLAIIKSIADTAIADISDEVGHVHIDRNSKMMEVLAQLNQKRFVNITGLPGSGKSAILRNVAQALAAKGPLLFLKSDMLQGTDWQSFAITRRLRHLLPIDLLAEIGAVGNAVLLIDGIDRIAPPQRNIVIDLLRVMSNEPTLSNWKVLVTSRNQGLEPFRAWLPTDLYQSAGIGDVSVGRFDDKESEHLADKLPSIRGLLFGTEAVREIARRPFFAAVLARGAVNGTVLEKAHSEVDLISYWWSGGGYDATPAVLPQRQRALLDLAQVGARVLGKSVSSLEIAADTTSQLAELQIDGIVKTADEGATFSFTHDIFFEWAFYRLVISLGPHWTDALIAAGEAPFLGRVISLFSQHKIAGGQSWESSYASLETGNLRPQWRRAWLTGPPASPVFAEVKDRFEAFLIKDDFALLKRFLVWFQAEHTMPSPIITANENLVIDGAARIRAADLLGWPSDAETWGRVLDWLMALLDGLPIPLLPHVLELFKVWQNAFGDVKNKWSSAILERCGGWLIDIEGLKYKERLSFNHGRWDALGGDAGKAFESGLRQILLRSIRAYPNYAEAILDRTIGNERQRKETYEELIAYSPLLSSVAPQKLADLAFAELQQLLPKEKIEKKRRASMQRSEALRVIREKPEQDRTEQEQRALAHMPFFSGSNEYDLEDIGIDRYNHAYFPASPLHEPFGSLFKSTPVIALALVRNLANRAMEGWRQVHALYPKRFGTPIPLDLEFPWGAQRFWGDWKTYNWIKGQLAPQPLECAFLALAYWAHKQLDAGRPVDDLIGDVVQGHECWTVLCLAGALSLESFHVSATVLPIASCQRLWHMDLARVSQESVGEIDLFGLSSLNRQSSDREQALTYLKNRRSRYREMRDLVPVFAHSSEDSLRLAFEAKVSRFPQELPFDYEEQRDNADAARSLKETADQWAEWGKAENYRKRVAGDNAQIIVEYKPPQPTTQAVQERLTSSRVALDEHSIFAWAGKSIRERILSSEYELSKAIELARDRDSPSTFRVLVEAGAGMAQSAISGTAACAIRFGGVPTEDLTWAWNVMSRVERMREAEGPWGGGNMPWHPGFHLAMVLEDDLSKEFPRSDTAARLLRLTLHPNKRVGRAALGALLATNDVSLAWIATCLASDLFIRHDPVIHNDGSRDWSADKTARKAALRRAQTRLKSRRPTPLTVPPPAWVKTKKRRGSWDWNENTWSHPEVSFDSQVAEEVVRAFPVEKFCRSDVHRPLLLKYFSELVAWTDARLDDADVETSPPHQRRRERGDLHLWPGQLGDLLARICPFVELIAFRDQYLLPFIGIDDEAGLSIVSEFTDMVVCRHIYDAEVITSDILAILELCLDRLISDPVFHRNGYRAGKVHGADLPKVIRALLLVSVNNAPAARRFANGNWTDLPQMMPLVTRLIEHVAWAPFVMDCFLTLCERADPVYPIDGFAGQVTIVMQGLGKEEESWLGTMLPARTSGMVQRLADANFPLSQERARKLLFILDTLIDLGDRRSAALQQAEAFRNTQRH